MKHIGISEVLDMNNLNPRSSLNLSKEKGKRNLMYKSNLTPQTKSGLEIERESRFHKLMVIRRTYFLRTDSKTNSGTSENTY